MITQLLDAMREGQEARARHLIQTLHTADADLNGLVEDDLGIRGMLLHHTIQCGLASLIPALHAAGARPDERDDLGRTPLHLAAEMDNVPAIQALHEAGADLNAHNAEKFTPACVAAMNGAVASVTALREAGADLNAPTPAGDSLVHLAARFERVALIEALDEAGAPLDAPNRDGQTPAQVAHQAGPAVQALELALHRRSMERVMAALDAEKDPQCEAMSADLRCQITYEPFTPHGDGRPVRLPAGTDPQGGRVPGRVMSASAALRAIGAGRCPFTRAAYRDQEVLFSYHSSVGFNGGDPERLALVRAAMVAGGRDTAADMVATMKEAMQPATQAGMQTALQWPASHYTRFLDAAPPPGARPEPRQPQP